MALGRDGENHKIRKGDPNADWRKVEQKTKEKAHNQVVQTGRTWGKCEGVKETTCGEERGKSRVKQSFGLRGQKERDCRLGR